MKDSKLILLIIVTIILGAITFASAFQWTGQIMNNAVPFDNLPGWATILVAVLQLFVVLFIDYKWGKYIYKQVLIIQEAQEQKQSQKGDEQ